MPISLRLLKLEHYSEFRGCLPSVPRSPSPRRHAPRSRPRHRRRRPVPSLHPSRHPIDVEHGRETGQPDTSADFFPSSSQRQSKDRAPFDRIATGPQLSHLRSHRQFGPDFLARLRLRRPGRYQPSAAQPIVLQLQMQRASQGFWGREIATNPVRRQTRAAGLRPDRFFLEPCGVVTTLPLNLSVFFSMHSPWRGTRLAIYGKEIGLGNPWLLWPPFRWGLMGGRVRPSGVRGSMWAATPRGTKKLPRDRRARQRYLASLPSRLGGCLEARPCQGCAAP